MFDDEKPELEPVDPEETADSAAEKEESIPLCDGRNAFFSGKTILFPDKNGGGLQSVRPERQPLDESASAINTDRPFLSFFDEPESGRNPDSFSSFFQDEDSETEKNGDDTLPFSSSSEDIEEEENESDEESTLSFDDYVQTEALKNAKEDLDNLIRQNDADTLFTLGEQYEREEDPESGESESNVNINPTSILEAMIFVGNRENRPLPIDKAIALMRNVTKEDALKSIADLNRRYEEISAPYRIQISEEGFLLELRPELEPVRERFFSKVREVKLSQKAIDVLALIAYRQPISSAEIQAIRPQSGGILNILLKRDLIEQKTVQCDNGESVQYQTSPRLLKILGISSVKELPIVDEIDYR